MSEPTLHVRGRAKSRVPASPYLWHHRRSGVDGANVEDATMKFRCMVFTMLATVPAIPSVSAQAYPAKPIRLVLPFAAGNIRAE